MSKTSRIVAASTLAALALAALPVAAPAAVDVGDAPTFRAPADGGGTVDLNQLRGKLVVIDFWASWCGPCSQSAPGLVALNDKYGDKGLQFLGVSWDRNPNDLRRGAKEHGLAWPQIYDSTKAVTNQFGVDSIPRTFLISPDGEVLWTGHPSSGLDKAIEAAMKDHPPTLMDPRALAAARASADEAERLIDAGDPAGAVKAFAALPPESADEPSFKDRRDEVAAKVARAADALLAEVDPLVADGDYAGASDRLTVLASSLEGTPAGDAASAKLKELQSDPAVKAALAEARSTADAATGLAVAEKFKADGKDDLAYARFREVAGKYADAEAGKAAAEQVAAYDADPAFAERAADAAAGSKARGQLSLARSYAAAGKPAIAREKLDRVIADFPGTSYAREAQRELEK